MTSFVPEFAVLCGSKGSTAFWTAASFTQDEIITTRCIKFYERLKFPWSHVNQSISLFNICQRKRQVPRRRKRFAAITALIITAIATAVAASTALGLAISNRVDHENLRQRVVKFEKVVEHNFRLVDDTVDGTKDVSEAINMRLSKAYKIVQKSFDGLERT